MTKLLLAGLLAVGLAAFVPAPASACPDVECVALPPELCFATLQACVSLDPERIVDPDLGDLIGPCTCDPIE